jgi:tryptophanyl-tRNA synthetase
VQPTGILHLGNYFGAIQQHIALQEEFPGECFYFIADYHALTTVHEPETLREYVRGVALTYLACGLDPEKALLFRQTDVPEVTELTWMLASVTGMGLLERAHSYKDKIAHGLKPDAGLFLYPVLMASDILIYQSSFVPVGRDQVQHIEMTQDMATYFNQAFCPSAPVLRRPEARLSETPYVPGIDGRKMSKSYDNTIPIFESGKKLRKIVGSVVTDSTPLGQPLPTESCNVFALLKLFCDDAEIEAISGYYREGRRDGEPFGYGHAKKMLADAIESHFADARARREELLAAPDRVEQVLRSSAARARAVAGETVRRCKKACGLL